MSNLKTKLCGTGLALVLSAAIPSFAQQTSTPPPNSTQTTTAPSSTPSTNNDSQSISPPASESISKPELPDSPSAAQPQQQPQQNQQNSMTSTQAPFQQPSGTAAAQQGRVSGTTLSEPAGVAIAPAKQRRTRSILIKMGFIAGAGIAIGTVAALSMASPSKPPGAP